MNLLERQERIVELQTEIATRRRTVHEKTEDGSITRREESQLTQEVEDLMTQISAVITDGAKPCPFCGERPHGIAQQVGLKQTVRDVFEVGCLTPKGDHFRELADGTKQKYTHPQARAVDVVPELAVARWNKGQYEPESNGPGIRLGSE